MEKGYQTLLSRRRFPIGVLALTIEPSRVDVNVHPTKREIRLSESSEVYRQVLLAVKQALEATTPFEPWAFPRQDETTEPAGKPSFVQETMDAPSPSLERRAIPVIPRYGRRRQPIEAGCRLPSSDVTITTESKRRFPPDAAPSHRGNADTGLAPKHTFHRILGQFQATYNLG